MSPKEVEHNLWQRYPKTAGFMDDLIRQLSDGYDFSAKLQDRLRSETGTRLADWLDYIILRGNDQVDEQLLQLGFSQLEGEPENGYRAYSHAGAVFPEILLKSGSAAEAQVEGAALKTESVAAFLAAHDFSAEIEGTPFSPCRRSRLPVNNGSELWVVERRGYRGFEPIERSPAYTHSYLLWYERWLSRPRKFAAVEEGLKVTQKLAEEMTAELETPQACWLVFAAERRYWEMHNRAGRIQKQRQDALGLGWANHDHHTFRSSRKAFPGLIKILETLGFIKREKFYAGEEAGWGAQVLEQPQCNLVVFADVDLSPEEVNKDFTRETLPDTQKPGTVELWSRLHGESILKAGLHHLSARFSFEEVTRQLAEEGVSMQAPFSDFSYLKQAFTNGEIWKTDEDHLRRLLKAGQITEKEQREFARKGAVGSHLENIQRGDGFKGFNQQSVSDIIRRTDPRRGSASD
ncbi:MAG: hypothetical protein WAN36_04915 [Calditrichia bacterium]